MVALSVVLTQWSLRALTVCSSMWGGTAAAGRWRRALYCHMSEVLTVVTLDERALGLLCRVLCSLKREAKMNNVVSLDWVSQVNDDGGVDFGWTIVQSQLFGVCPYCFFKGCKAPSCSCF